MTVLFFHILTENGILGFLAVIEDNRYHTEDSG
jgi:hypothetical protein